MIQHNMESDECMSSTAVEEEKVDVIMDIDEIQMPARRRTTNNTFSKLHQLFGKEAAANNG